MNAPAGNVSGSRIHFFGAGLPGSEPAGLDVLGGKGVNLCELTRAEFPVPPGFVVTTQAYRDFVAAAGLGERIVDIVSRIKMDDPASLDGASAELRALFEDGEIPESLGAEILAAYRQLQETGAGSVAVRSSATAEDLPDASFAGQQDTYLNISGEQALLKAVRSCWGSLWTARAISYRDQQGIPLEGLALATAVQKMVMADAAGIMFTANPLTGARDEVVINGSWGLGEAVVGGQVTPDTVVVEKHTGEVREVTVSEKTVETRATADGTVESEISDDRRNARVLDDAQAARLALVACEVEDHYGSPQDIEWCLIGDDIFLVQARPITALPDEPVGQDEMDKVREMEIARLKQMAEGRGRVDWAIYNLAETLKHPTPLTWDVIRRWMGGSGGFVEMYRDLGYFPSERVDREGMLDLIGGRIYADLEKHAELFYGRMPLEYDIEAAKGDANALLEGMPDKFNFQRAGGGFLLRLPLYIIKLIRQGRRMKKTARKYLEEFNEEVKPRFLKYVKAARAKKLSEMSDEQVLAELEEREVAFNGIARESEKTSSVAVYYHGSLSKTLEDILGEKEGKALAAKLVMGPEDDKTIEQHLDLHRVAGDQLSLDQFLAEYGHRATDEFELAEPRWYEDPSFLQKQVASYRKASGGESSADQEKQRHERAAAERAKAEKDLTSILEEHGAASLEEDLRADLAGAQKYMPYRETSKYYYMMAYALIRDALQALAARWELGEDLYFLHREELAEYAGDVAKREELAANIARRRARWRALKELEMPEFVSSEEPEAVGRPVELKGAEDGVYVGKGVASGAETGVARIVHSPKEAGDLGTGYVLVCTSTDPGWTPLFAHAKGVIVERGGMLSHGAIVARDFGIPCVVLAGATKLIPDGAEIKIDGNRGSVALVGATVGEEA